MKKFSLVLFSLFLSVVSILFIASCDEKTTEPIEPTDTEAPTVIITYPADNVEILVGTQVTIQTDVSDNVEVYKVDFYINGINVETDYNSPYNYEWETPNISGDHTIYAKAVDTSENEANSNLISVHVNEVVLNNPPVINSLTAYPSSVTPGNISTIICNASDIDGDALTYSWSVQEGSISGNGFTVIYYAPDELGYNIITCVVTDGNGGEDSKTETVHVIMNTPPQINYVLAIPTFVEPGGTCTIICNATDANGDSLSYYWGTSNGSITGNGSTANFIAPSINENYCTVTCMIDDNNGGTDSEIENITLTSGTDPVTDIDDNVYQTIRIGDQVWMSENLKVTHYNNGDEMPTGYSNSEWIDLSTGAFCIYDDDPSNIETYGAIYNWYAVNDSRGIAPTGWHMPTDEEIVELELYLGISIDEVYTNGNRGTNQGSAIAGRTDLWNDGNLENNAEFGTRGFIFLPGGYRNYSEGEYVFMHTHGIFWTSTQVNNDLAKTRSLAYNTPTLSRFSNSKGTGFSVRCVRD